MDIDIKSIIQQYNIIHEKFTQEQLAEVFKQIILSGDIVRYTCGVFPNEKQAIIYHPLHRVEELRHNIDKLQAKLEKTIEQRDKCIRLRLEEFTADESQIADVIREHNEELEDL